MAKTRPGVTDYHDEQTLFKVRAGLRRFDPFLDEQALTDIIGSIQNEGILFREREPEGAPRTWPQIVGPPASVRQVTTPSGLLWTRMDDGGHYWSAPGWPGGVAWMQVLSWGPVTEVKP